MCAQLSKVDRQNAPFIHLHTSYKNGADFDMQAFENFLFYFQPILNLMLKLSNSTFFFSNFFFFVTFEIIYFYIVIIIYFYIVIVK